MQRVSEQRTIQKRFILFREAEVGEAAAIRDAFNIAYEGKYPLEFGNNVETLKAEICDTDHYLWLIAEDQATRSVIGTMMFNIDKKNRMAKAGGAVIIPDYRHLGLASTLLKMGVRYLTETSDLVDVIYGTSRTVSEGPSKLVADAGFIKTGFFPNAVQIEEMEHLNLDLYLTEKALVKRRKKPYLFAPFYDVYHIPQRQLGLERAYLITEREPLRLSNKTIPLSICQDEKKAIECFRLYSEQKRIMNSFFPFHMPNWMLSTADGGTDVFIWYGGNGKQASIVGFRTDRVNTHDLLDSVALTLQKAGAAYVEMIVDAYDYMVQQETFTAKYIPSAYFPAMRLANDGLRDDYFVVSRTFQILDFTKAVVMAENYDYFAAYMRLYNQLYIAPVQRMKPRASNQSGHRHSRRRSDSFL